MTIKRHGWATTDEPFLRLTLYLSQIDLPRPPAKFDQRITRAQRKHQTRDMQVLNLMARKTIKHRMIGKLKFKQGLAAAVLDASAPDAASVAFFAASDTAANAPVPADTFLTLCWKKLEE